MRLRIERLAEGPLAQLLLDEEGVGAGQVATDQAVPESTPSSSKAFRLAP